MIVVMPYDEPQDIAIKLYGTADALVKLAKANTLGIDSVLLSGTLLEEVEFTPADSDPDLLVPYVLSEPVKQAQVIERQNITDMALQEYGSADALVQLCKLNGFALDGVIVPGALKVGNSIRKSVRDYYLATGKKVCTDGVPEVAPAILMEDGSFILMEDGGKILME